MSTAITTILTSRQLRGLERLLRGPAMREELDREVIRDWGVL
jgi:hypothetical protein